MKFIFFLTFVATSFLNAKDLPNEGFVVNRMSQPVDIQFVKAAEITKNKVETTVVNETLKVTHGKAVLEIKAQVEGNLCIGTPEDVFLSLKRDSGTVSHLSMSYSYFNDPHDFTIYGCTSHGVMAQITLPLQLDIYYQNEEGYRQTLNIQTLVPAFLSGTGKQESILKKVHVKHDPNSGFSAEVE